LADNPRLPHNSVNPFIRVLKTIQQVGLLPVLQVGLYRFGLLTGHYRRVSQSQQKVLTGKKIDWLPPTRSVNISNVAGLLQTRQTHRNACLKDARLILGGKCKIFGNQIVDIFPEGIDSSHIWTDYETRKVPLPVDDIKFIWEPARLGWMFSLARAYTIGEVPSLGKDAWRLLETFLQRNPVNQGPNWMNGQEVALRIFALVFFHEVFRNDSGMPADWDHTLARAVVTHAKRIPTTLVYARSQQNNHLLVEAAGLYTAGVFLPDHPNAGEWRKTGWQVFHKALDAQIQADGTYAQYSTNYHRLMLQVALWMKAISMRAGDEFPETSTLKLAAATNWLKKLTDPRTGRVPNYGHNDGAYIFPLSGFPFEDYRPVVKATDYFFGVSESPAESDEMTLWFEWLAGGSIQRKVQNSQNPPIESNRTLSKGNSSAVMFGPYYTGRPGQADVLHTEIWWAGKPIAMDAGTYLYNAAPPWNNVLAQTKFHNTVSVFEQNQMQRAGRFLWLDCPNVKWDDSNGTLTSMSASQDGYRRFGVIHKRQIEYMYKNTWRVHDQILPIKNGDNSDIDVWLHWLLAALNWKDTDTGIQFGSGSRRIRVDVIPVISDTLQRVESQFIKAGVLIGSQPKQESSPTDLLNFGWVSPIYGLKEPAFSLRVVFRGKAPLNFYTQFQFG
jgi:hypothetical protein